MNSKRQHLFDLCFDSIQLLATHAVEEAGEDFVILVLDLRDDYSKAIAEYLRIATKADADETIQRAGKEGIPTMVAAVRKATAITILETRPSVFAKTVQNTRLPERIFWVAVFDDGGHSVAGVPFQEPRAPNPRP